MNEPTEAGRRRHPGRAPQQSELGEAKPSESASQQSSDGVSSSGEPPTAVKPPKPVKPSDLGQRTLSAIVMFAVAILALWLGGWAWTLLVTAVALGVLWEWNGLITKFSSAPVSQFAWLFFGVIYIGTAALALWDVRQIYSGLDVFVGYLSPIFAVDIGAYFVGRAIGGPKIAPALSPSKTWAGLFGGMLGAFAVCLLVNYLWPEAGQFVLGGDGTFGWSSIIGAAVYGALIAIVAQMGDFFESWMKRRAGVKDSSNLIPGHGGLFDRTDGLIAVFFMLGIGLAITRTF